MVGACSTQVTDCIRGAVAYVNGTIKQLRRGFTTLDETRLREIRSKSVTQNSREGKVKHRPGVIYSSRIHKKNRESFVNF